MTKASPVEVVEAALTAGREGLVVSYGMWSTYPLEDGTFVVTLEPAQPKGPADFEEWPFETARAAAEFFCEKAEVGEAPRGGG